MTTSHAQFELEWMGGRPEALLRRRRPGIDELPWGTLSPAAFTPAALLEARKVWTNGAFTEYASAAAFTTIAGAFMECGAPIDLSAAAADFAVDELTHAELAARLLMELGGAVPYEVDLARLAPLSTAATPLGRAAELVLKVASVGEALSVPILAASLRAADQPLTRAVLDKLVRDEGPHARIGDWFFDWAGERLTDADRSALADVALDAIAVYAPLWQREPCDSCQPAAAFGGIPREVYRRTMIESVQHRIAAPLARHGIMLDSARLATLL